MDNKEPEKRNGFVRIDEKDCIKIEAYAEAWVDTLPISAVYAFVKRYHHHLLTKMFMDDRNAFDTFIKNCSFASNAETDGTVYENPHATYLATQMDMLMGFQGMTDAEMNEANPQIPLPDSDFFKGLGLE